MPRRSGRLDGVAGSMVEYVIVYIDIVISTKYFIYISIYIYIYYYISK
jgi:hypothetical protein